jgi:hypothetical protein
MSADAVLAAVAAPGIGALVTKVLTARFADHLARPSLPKPVAA